MGERDLFPPNIDYAHDWRMAELELLAQQTRARVRDQQLPPWLSFRSESPGDWYAVRVLIDGEPVGPPLTWPNACFIGAWLLGCERRLRSGSDDGH